MIYEFRTYTLKPRTQNDFMKRFEDALEKRQKLSPLAAFWYTEIGPLNQIIHVWPYADAGERARIRGEAVKTGVWPPPIHDMIVDMRSEIFEPLPFCPPLTPSSHGPIFEMRSYVIEPGGTADMAKRWVESLPGRLKLSPLIGVFTCDTGPLNQWVHIWAYNSLEHRGQIRKTAMEGKIWPPPGASPVARQETKILMPASFSPIK